MSKKKAVYIEWDDACSEQGWIHKDSPRTGVMPCKSIGYVIAEDAVSITISTTWELFDRCCDPLTIPKSSISKRRVLKVPKE